MRRLWAATVTIVVCLTFGGLPAFAQQASPSAAWTAVTGTSVCGTVATPGTAQSATPPYTLTGHVMACTKTASDRRVTGAATTVLNVETWDPDRTANAVVWGDEEIQGPDGAWTGRFYGIWDAEGVIHLMHITAGSGVYEGWTYAYASTVPANSFTGITTGVIQHSAPPTGFPVRPVPEPVPSPASE